MFPHSLWTFFNNGNPKHTCTYISTYVFTQSMRVYIHILHAQYDKYNLYGWMSGTLYMKNILNKNLLILILLRH